MRVAAMAFVLVVGAAVVLVFANTLNAWVLGGLLGGLAAILLSIPISLMLFTLLARRHDARQRSARLPFEDEQEMYDAPVVYEAEGYLLPQDEDFSEEPRARSLVNNRRMPVSGYLPLPPAERDLIAYEDELERSGRQDPRNYPRQPRFAARSLAPDNDIQSPPRPSSSLRHPSTRSLALHQSAALRMARQEAQQQRSEKREGSGPSRRPQGSRFSSSRRPTTSRSFRPQAPASRRPIDEYETGAFQQQYEQASWEEDEDFSDGFSTEELRERYQQYPRRPSYPRHPRASRARATDPWTGSFEEEENQEEQLAYHPQRDPDRMYGNLHNPLVRRAPYLYEDDPLLEEFTQQIENGRPIRRRSSRYEHFEEDEG